MASAAFAHAPFKQFTHVGPLVMMVFTNVFFSFLSF
jgi:hypothetical protein